MVIFVVMLSFNDYIQTSFGLKVDISDGSKISRNLPLYLKAGFNISAGSIEGRKLLWVEINEGMEITPGRLKGHAEELKRYTNLPPVFIFYKLDSWLRKRLIESRIAFVQAEKQLYIPELMLQLSDVQYKDSIPQMESTSFSFPTQVVLLSHLQAQLLENMSFQEIGLLLDYSAMTVTRVVKELAAKEIVEVTGSKEKRITFLYRGMELWKQILPYLRSPIKEKWYCDTRPIGKFIYIAGENALSQNSMLSKPDQLAMAIGKDDFMIAKENERIPELDKTHGHFELQVWHYRPIKRQSNEIEKDSEPIVDSLSLYLSLEKIPDERLAYELEQLLKSTLW